MIETTLYYPEFLLNLEHHGKTEDDLRFEAGEIVHKIYYDSLPDAERKRINWKHPGSLRFADRHSVQFQHDQRSSHQKMAEAKSADVDFEACIRESWRTNFTKEGNGYAWYLLILPNFMPSLSGQTYPETLDLTDEDAIKPSLKCHIELLFEAAIRTGQQALDKTEPGQDTEWFEKRLRTRKERLPRILNFIDQANHGAYSPVFGPSFEEWMTFDLTGGKTPNAIFTQEVSLFSDTV